MNVVERQAARRKTSFCAGVWLVHKHRDSAYGLTIVWALVSFCNRPDIHTWSLQAQHASHFCCLFWRTQDLSTGHAA